ncbi:MAG: serine/threonine-protein kinase [Planctomycetota bacterium]
MSVEAEATEPVLDDVTRDFVRRTMHAGLVELSDVKKVVVSLMADGQTFTPVRLAEGLVNADLLTPWQSRKLLAGKGRGFFLGNYKLLRPLGKGGMGVVFLAQHSVMNRQMALKILPAEASKDERRIERFKEEARASAKLEHRNIVQAFDFSQADGKLFIVMEYIEGVDLHRAVSRDGVMSPPESLDAVIQTTDALAHAHQRGIVHRDIKPSNLLLRSDGVVKVSDMGLARIGFTPGNADAPNRLTGTADFIAPEQAIDSQTVDARADIYSLGCTWYFLLTGRPPYTGSSVAQRLAKHQTAKIPSVLEVRQDCPKPMALLIQRMMAKRPSERPESAAELLHTLQRLSKNSPPRGELANRQPEVRALASSDDSSNPFDDSGPLKDATPSSVADTVGEIDFGSLPPIDLATAQIINQSPATETAPQFRSPQPIARGNSTRPAQDAQQSMLLGVGLALSILALLTVVGVTLYTMTRPTESRGAGIKAVETTDENGKKQITVID